MLLRRIGLQFAYGLRQRLQFFLYVEEVGARPDIGVRFWDEADDKFLHEELLSSLLRCHALNLEAHEP